MHVLKYLAGTKSFGLKWVKGGGKLEGFLDSDFSEDLDGYKFTSGFELLTGDTAVSWGSKLSISGYLVCSWGRF